MQFAPEAGAAVARLPAKTRVGTTRAGETRRTSFMVASFFEASRTWGQASARPRLRVSVVETVDQGDETVVSPCRPLPEAVLFRCGVDTVGVPNEAVAARGQRLCERDRAEDGGEEGGWASGF